MSKFEKKAAALFDRTSHAGFVEAFEEKEGDKASSNFRQEFVAAPLSKEEDNALQRILFEDFSPNQEEAIVSDDYQSLTTLTQQIRAIDRQSILLHGERIQQAQSLLKRYKEGAFTSWLMLTYGNRQTPYRMLRFHELFQELERHDRSLLEQMPKKAAYSLAMREGELSEKVKIIREHHAEDPDLIINAIQALLPLQEGDKRAKRLTNDESVLKALEAGVYTLKKRKEDLSESTRQRLSELVKVIVSILER